MTGGTRIIAIDTGEHDRPPVELHQSGEQAGADAPLLLDDLWDEEPQPARPARAWRWRALLGISIALVLGWSALWFSANQAAMLHGGNPAQWVGWIRDWSAPVLLLALVWLLAMRSSSREAARFGDVARQLGAQSAELEARLGTVNGELGLAREFLAAQTRDLDALGRIATERLSDHAERLNALIADNGARIDAIGTVSAAALENMEKLRGQLPVMASAAKDVTNNIGNAGRTAHAQIEDMVSAFNKLNTFGQASERQVQTLRELVTKVVAEFTAQADHLGTITTDRFAALTAHGEEFRGELDRHEAEALTAIAGRAGALRAEIESAQAAIARHESEAETALRARIAEVQQHSAAITGELRAGEAAALAAWESSVGRLENDLRHALGEVSALDEAALASARAHLATIETEATALTTRLAEHDAQISAQIGERHALLGAQHAALGNQLADQLGAIDEAIASRSTAHRAQLEQLAAHSRDIGAQIDAFGARIATISTQGSATEASLRANVAAVSEHLTASHAALAQTEAGIAAQTDGSVRLLELIQASVQHSAHDLPAAIGASDARLAAIEDRVKALGAEVSKAENGGAALAGHSARSHEELAAALAHSTALNEQIAAQSAALLALQDNIASTRDQTRALAAEAQDELHAAIAALEAASRTAVEQIETASASAVTALAARIGEQSGAAIDAALDERSEAVAGKLDEVTARAAGVSREAVVQLRDQFAKVDELAGNLERRVTQARNRAEEQVDNDFARRIALITEALNSNSIDIARALDSDVSDTAWSSYLKGDRGVFTRRAVRLLDSGEAKSVATLFEQDRPFRDHVSRYIHDFEAMLRQLLSTRDGHALGVTLLSSDMGKLYVALAQAIDRLRN